MNRERIAVVVTHLLGVGHLVRAAALARAFGAGGDEVLLVTGGAPARMVDLDGLQVRQLPPVRSDGVDFSRLLTLDGRPVDDALLAERRGSLVTSVLDYRPTVLVVELYPFGRRVLREEFDALLGAVAALRPRPAIVASIRDVLAPPSRPEKAASAETRLARWFDAVLAHGDADAIPLDASWPVSDGLRAILRHTGYVDAAPDEAIPAHGRDPRLVVISGGGGVAGLPLFRAGIAAARVGGGRFRCHILVGDGVGEGDFAGLVADAAGAPVLVERARPDFRDLLRQAAVSVSRAGYNTVLDIARTGVAPILVPFEDGGETEQRVRADALADLGLARLLAESDLSGETLAAAILDERDHGAGRPAFTARTDGAGRSREIVRAAAVAARSRDAALSSLEAAIAAERAAGRAVEIWWRDDDAARPTPQLDRLLALRARIGAPLAIATIPATATPALAERLGGEPAVDVLVHGLAHENRAGPGSKKQELVAPADPETLRAPLAEALRRMRSLFGSRLLPVLVPPWNRIDPAAIDLLPAAGFAALSAFAGRYDGQGPPDLVRLDAHLDSVDWKTGRRISHERMYAATARLVGSRRQEASPPPIGLLTHHLRHDEWMWASIEDWLERMASMPGIRFVSARDALARSIAAGRVANRDSVS